MCDGVCVCVYTAGVCKQSLTSTGAILPPVKANTALAGELSIRLGQTQMFTLAIVVRTAVRAGSLTFGGKESSKHITMKDVIRVKSM